jgi:hypothetical protein
LRTLQLPQAIDLQQRLGVLRDRNLCCARRRDRQFFGTFICRYDVEARRYVLRLSGAFVTV